MDNSDRVLTFDDKQTCPETGDVRYVETKVSNFGFIAKQRFTGLAYILMDRGQSVMSAFRDAMRVGAHQLASVLLRKSDPANIPNLYDPESDNMTLLAMVAASPSESSYTLELVRVLVQEFGYKYDAITASGMSLLHLACKQAHVQLMAAFLPRCDVTARDAHGMDALAHLLSNERVSFGGVAMLVERGADVNSWRHVDLASLSADQRKQLEAPPLARIMESVARAADERALKHLESLPTPLDIASPAFEAWAKKQAPPPMLKLGAYLLQHGADWTLAAPDALPTFHVRLCACVSIYTFIDLFVLIFVFIFVLIFVLICPCFLYSHCGNADACAIAACLLYGSQVCACTQRRVWQRPLTGRSSWGRDPAPRPLSRLDQQFCIPTH